MIALWYRNGELEPASVPDGRRHVLRVAFPPVSVKALAGLEPMSPRGREWVEIGHLLRRGEIKFRDDWQKWPRAARRWLARWGVGRGPGRRRAKPVPRGRWVPRPPIPGVEVVLYLPEDESVMRLDLDNVERWLAARGMAGTK